MNYQLNPALRADILRLYILKNYRGPTEEEMRNDGTYVVNIYSDVDMACV